MSSKHHRGQMEIIRELVSSSRAGARITHLMHAGNLSHSSLLVSIDQLLKAGLVEERLYENSKMYFVTMKGLKFLTLYDELESLTYREIDPFLGLNSLRV